MPDDVTGAMITRIRFIENEVADLRRTLDGAPLSVSDRQYLSRCVDLLMMELGAMREYVEHLS